MEGWGRKDGKESGGRGQEDDGRGGVCINNLVDEAFRLEAKRKSSGSERGEGGRGVGSGKGTTGNEGRELTWGAEASGTVAMRGGEWRDGGGRDSEESGGRGQEENGGGRVCTVHKQFSG